MSSFELLCYDVESIIIVMFMTGFVERTHIVFQINSLLCYLMCLLHTRCGWDLTNVTPTESISTNAIYKLYLCCFNNFAVSKQLNIEVRINIHLGNMYYSFIHVHCILSMTVIYHVQLHGLLINKLIVYGLLSYARVGVEWHSQSNRLCIK